MLYYSVDIAIGEMFLWKTCEGLEYTDGTDEYTFLKVTRQGEDHERKRGKGEKETKLSNAKYKTKPPNWLY